MTSNGHIHEVKLHQTRLVFGLVTTFGGSTILVFIQATQPGNPSVGTCNAEYWRWFQPPLKKKWQVLHSSVPHNQNWLKSVKGYGR